VADRRIAIEAIEQHTHTPVARSPVQRPVQIEIRSDVRLVEMPEHPGTVRERTDQVASHEMRIESGSPQHAVDEPTLIDECELARRQRGEHQRERRQARIRREPARHAGNR
jgi:hypothetical protein